MERTVKYPDPATVFPNNLFLSVVVPHFCRIGYLKRALDSLARHADMPFEVIVHDDASSDADREELFGLSDQISITLFNNGHNMGLNEAVNRCVEMASSKYILFICDDCFLYWQWKQYHWICISWFLGGRI